MDRQRAVSVTGNLDGLVLADAVARARKFAAPAMAQAVMALYDELAGSP